MDATEKNRSRLKVTELLTPHVQRIRMLGSAAIDLVWVAEGRLDATIALSNKPWDTVAGVVIAREAGARVVDIDGDPHSLRARATIAASPGLLDQVLAILGRGIVRESSPHWSTGVTDTPRRDA
jgi:myo-inositol-1(or 4)-monophosphatase